MHRMRWARVPIAAVCGLAAIAAVAPAAQAQYPDPLYPATHDQQCEKSSSLIQGRGATFARTAQLNWGAEIVINDPAPALAKGFGYDSPGCAPYKLSSDGGTKEVNYNPGGSGSGRAVMGASNTAGAARDLTMDFGASEEGPADKPGFQQVTNANEGPCINGVTAGGSACTDNDDGIMHTIPIAAGAVTASIRIPDGCQIANLASRQLSRARLEGFFRGLVAFDQWFELFGSNIKASPGSPLTDAQCQAKKPKRVVRFDNSGTTFLFKRYLDAAAAGAFDWSQAEDGGSPPLPNNVWPAATINGGLPGNGPLLDTLNAQGVDGGIGYGDVGAARGRGFGWDYVGGVATPDDRSIWVRVQQIATNSYISPAKADNQLGAKGARCTNVQYANQPATTEDSWFDVTGVPTPTDYPICGLTYALAWESFSAVGINSLTRAVGRRDYLGYILDRPGLGTTPPSSQCDPADPRYGKGQCKLPANDYSRLPPDVFTKARAGVTQLGP